MINSFIFVDLNQINEPIKSTVVANIFGDVSHLLSHEIGLDLRIYEVDFQDKLWDPFPS